MNAKDQDRFIALAAIAQPHGVHGRVKLKLFTESVDSFTQLAQHLTDENGQPFSLKITGESAGMVVVSIEGINNRNDAEKIRGTTLGVARHLLPEPGEGEYYHEDLIGLRAINADTNDEIGTITGVDNFGAGDIITIRHNGEQQSEMLLALNDETFTQIDIQAGSAMVQLPDFMQAKEEASS